MVADNVADSVAYIVADGVADSGNASQPAPVSRGRVAGRVIDRMDGWLT